jgi:acyl transferase domain-containing protein
MRVGVSLPEAAADLRPPVDAPASRGTRLLPLSAKSGDALAALARSYLDWLDERQGDLSTGEASDPLLADLAWTAGVGRSHFDFRAGVVFRDLNALREGLSALAAPDGVEETEPVPPTPGTVGFACSGNAGPWVAAAGEFYEAEPVFRAVLDRCEEVLAEERGMSLLKTLFGGKPSSLESSEWSGPALYAVQCGLMALWSSLGVRPRAATGRGAGKLAAAQAAGTLGLEDGLRRAAAGAAALEGGIRDPELPEAGSVVVEIGPEALPGGGPPTVPVVSTFPTRSGEGASPSAHEGFVGAVAAAYTAGLSVSFEGLFAGETRSRIALPGYPFERRRYWIQPSNQRA